MVFVKVRETYDLHTVKNKMTVIGIHTPSGDIIKRNFPGLLLQCKAYRPVSCDVRVACASVLPLDPKGVGLSENDVAPEDIFNPILYKAMSNKGMSQLEARIQALTEGGVGIDVNGESATVDVDSITNQANEFNVYYGLLANAHGWKHANPQAGLEMRSLRPLVYEMNYNIGDMSMSNTVGYTTGAPGAPDDANGKTTIPIRGILGKSKPMPFINCTSYTAYKDSGNVAHGEAVSGFESPAVYNGEQDVPSLRIMCGCIIIPPSRLHELFYRMVCEWTLEFSAIRPIGEILNFLGVASLGSAQHYQNYSYEATKEALTGTDESCLDSDVCMVSSNVDIEKVM